ncbi:hypothetical protein PPACK8108_LOCUS25513 [Phakopsora pachyrhizi]|uniref:Uncharacterized protein n=1 Tax=Phakopsora pachyrhizi TaxID=170000 RepID=A0AAV0BU59_PHAPC|nr:hypothetical protein PPACK8108_LOCUS25513 [Phakopsora pachyrhizi]
MLISKGTHQGREQAMGWLTAEYQEQMQAQKVIARERGKGQSDRRAGHTHTQAEGNRATKSIKTEGRPRADLQAGQGRAQLSSASLGWVLGRWQARLGLVGQGQVGQTGRLGWVLDRLGSWADKRQVGMAGLEVGQTGQFKGRFDLQKPDKMKLQQIHHKKILQRVKTPPGKETSVKDGFKGKTPLAGKGNTVNFE